MTKYKRIYCVHFFLPEGNLGMQTVKANNAKQAKERFYKRYPSKKLRRWLSTSRYEGNESILINSAI